MESEHNNRKRNRMQLMAILAVSAVIFASCWKPVKLKIITHFKQPDYLLEAISNSSALAQVKAYIDNGGDINAIQKDRYGNPISFRRSGDIYEVDDRDRFALGDAARFGRPELVKYLLNKGAKINLRTRSGSTALHFCCQGYSSLFIVKQLVDKGADINAAGPGGLTPLDCVRIENLELIRYLIDKGARVGARKVTFKEADLFSWPSEENRLERENIMAADRSATASLQRTLDELLVKASSKQAYETAEYLLQKGANPNAKDTINGHSSILLYLLPDGDGNFVAPANAFAKAEKPQTAKFVELLIQHGAGVKQTSHENALTALHIACDRHDYRLAEILLRAGADPNAKDKAGKTPYGHLVPVEKQLR